MIKRLEDTKLHKATTLHMQSRNMTFWDPRLMNVCSPQTEPHSNSTTSVFNIFARDIFNDIYIA